MNAQPTDEFCPKCGEWHTTLVDQTGWCAACTSRSGYHDPTALTYCTRCKTMSSGVGISGKGWCRACCTQARRERRHANREREAAYQRARPRGRCPICLQKCYLTVAGVVTNHRHDWRRSNSGDLCLGSRRPPLTEGPL